MKQISSRATIVGNGPIHAIALHGWFGSARAWRPLAEVIDGTRLTIACMDYRGYGARVDEPGEYTMAEIASDALELADQLGWRRFNLIGHSMGGMAIQRVMVEAPERIERMLAITPVPASGVPFDEAGWALFSSAAGDAGARETIIDMTTGQRLSKHWVAAIARHSIENSIPEAFGAYLLAWAKTDFADRVKGSEIPMKVVIGEHDPSLTQAVMDATYLRWYRNASLEMMGNAGHYPIDETPVALATAIERFLVV